MTKLLLAGIVAMVPVMAHAGTKELPNCDSDQVQETLIRVTRVRTIVDTRNITTSNPTESRFCKSEILTSNGLLAEAVYELRWTSEAEGRFWLQIQGGRIL
jgi:hypothetical protein